jgi:protein O-GlcNAc transferase
MNGDQMTVAQALRLAQQYQAQGRLQEADALFRRALQAEPNNPDAWHLLGLLARQAGNHGAEANCIIRAIGLNGRVATYHASLGNAMQALGQPDRAMQCYGRALELQPESAETRYNMGVLLQGLGRADEAIAAYRVALQHRPDFVEALCNLGALLQARRQLDAAEECYRKALAARPGFAIAHFNLGTVLRQGGRLEPAVDCFRAAIRLQPGYREAYENLGDVLEVLKRFDEAVDTYRAALAIDPGHADVLPNLGTLLMAQGMQAESLECCRALDLLRPAYREAHDNLLFSLLYCAEYSPEAIFAEHREYARRFATGVPAAPHDNVPDPDRRLRIGYNSYDFGNHAVSWFLEPLLAHHDHSRFEIFCYANRDVQDALKQRITALADHWRSLAGLDDGAAAELIRRDRIDILIDLSGHSTGNRLPVFARKPAPLQATWLGYLHSTGLDQIDYRISDHYADPPGMTERYHSERLLRLPDSQWCYGARPDSPEPSPLPALSNGYLTFASFHNLAKVTNRVLDLWGRLLARVPDARLRMISVAPGRAAERIRQAFAAHGVAAERLTLLPALPLYEYLEQYREVDIALDTFPYNGGTTGCDTLWMGVPPITLAGEHSIARGGVSVLSNLGLHEFIATTPEQYLDIAAGWTARIGQLAALRAGLRQRMLDSPLMDAKRFAGNMEAAYRGIWREWCAGRQASGG